MGHKRFLCETIPAPKRPAKLSDHEAHHALKVFRLHPGDEVEALDGKGHAVIAFLRVHDQGVYLEYSRPSSLQEAEAPKGGLILEVAALKGEAMEWLIEKSVELGVEELVPLLTDHTVVQVDQNKKGPEVFQGRWQKIADQALKQCGRTKALKVHPPRPLHEHLASGGSPLRLWADENAKEETLSLNSLLRQVPLDQRIAVLIGPEGGWSEKERAFLQRMGIKRMGLGPLTLRAETAALILLSALRLAQLDTLPQELEK